MKTVLKMLAICMMAGGLGVQSVYAEPLVIQEQGSFSAGGTIITAPGTFDAKKPLDSAGQTYHGDHASVFYQIPENPHKYPIVMLHGAGQSSRTWESTPDGREGFQNIFLRLPKDIDAIIFTLGSDGQGRIGARAIDYGGVRNILRIFMDTPVRIALMTTIGVTERLSSWNQRTEVHDWKRRSERLVRACGHIYTIVRPGWFDYNNDDEHRIVMLQGDRRHAGTPEDGVISREQIAQVLVTALSNDAAKNKTFELVAERGEAQQDLTLLFAELRNDNPQKNDGVFDIDNMPLTEEPECVINDLNLYSKNSKI